MATHVIVIHGTRSLRKWAGRSRRREWWQPGSSFCSALEASCGEHASLESFEWDGQNSHRSRLDAGTRLANRVRELRSGGADNISLVGHSHGGSVALAATSQLKPRSVQGIVLLACPHFKLVSDKPHPCKSMFETGAVDGDGCAGTSEHWLYWDSAPERSSGTIWNVYSPQDSVQGFGARWLPGLSLGETRTYRRLVVQRTYSGREHHRVRDELIQWRHRDGGIVDSILLTLGLSPHSAMHSSRMGRLVGLLVEGTSDFKQALASSGLEPNPNEIKDFGY